MSVLDVMCLLSYSPLALYFTTQGLPNLWSRVSNSRMACVFCITLAKTLSQLPHLNNRKNNAHWPVTKLSLRSADEYSGIKEVWRKWVQASRCMCIVALKHFTLALLSSLAQRLSSQPYNLRELGVGFFSLFSVTALLEPWTWIKTDCRILSRKKWVPLWRWRHVFPPNAWNNIL